MINKLTTDLNHVQALDDEPNDVTGLTPTQLKAVFDQAPNDIKIYINNLVDILNSTVKGFSGSENIGSPTIQGITGNTVYEQIANILTVAQAAQAGTILPGVVTDAMLSNDSGQIKDRFTSHLADMTNKLDKNGGTLQNYSEVTSTNGSANGNVTLDVTNGNVFNLTLTGATKLAFTTPVASGKECSFTLYLNQGATAYSVIFPSSLKWDNDSIPDLSSANKTNIMVFTTVNGGTRWYGRLAMGNLVT